MLIDKENADNSYISMVDEVPIQRVVSQHNKRMKSDSLLRSLN